MRTSTDVFAVAPGGGSGVECDGADCRHPRVHAQLRVGVLEMSPNGAGGDPERLGDLPVRPALRDELENLSLPGRQAGTAPALARGLPPGGRRAVRNSE